MSQRFEIRTARASDAEVIAWHRARMFQDMGIVPGDLFESFRAKCLKRAHQDLASGAYVGWLIPDPGNQEAIIAGAGVIVRQVPPFPLPQPDGGVTVADGKQALVINVFTEPGWRRRGLARLLMQTIIEWSQDALIDSLLLHASDDGRTLYEELGFIQTNEMRWRAECAGKQADAANRHRYRNC